MENSKIDTFLAFSEYSTLISIIVLLVVLTIYILTSIFLNKFNKLVYGKGTPMAWIPIFNLYLIGKLAFNKLVGWILIITLFLTGEFSTTINGVTTTKTILPANINSIVKVIYSVAVLAIFIYAIYKYFKIKKSKNQFPEKSSNQFNQAPNMNNQPQNSNLQNQFSQPINTNNQPQNFDASNQFNQPANMNNSDTNNI